MYIMNTLVGTTLLAVFLLTIDEAFAAAVGPSREATSLVAVGYSKDLQRTVSHTCYNVTVSHISGPHNRVKLGQKTSSSDLESELGIDVSASGGYGMFSASAEAKYLRSVQQKDTSISFNYYEYSSHTVSMEIAGSREKALTERGKDFYEGGNNPNFGLVCGDHYVTSYEEGALLIMGLNIKFSSSFAKESIESKVGAAWGDIVSVSVEVKKFAQEQKISGTVEIEAFQKGGNPSELSRILQSNSDGQFYAISCSLEEMDNCRQAASNLLSYASNNFPDQVSFKDNTGLTPLGIGFTRYESIDTLNLKVPTSLVTKQVEDARRDLACHLKKNEYYQRHLDAFSNHKYPVKLDSDLERHINTVLAAAKDNVHLLMKQHGGAIDCFNKPQKCTELKSQITSKLKPLHFNSLEAISRMKYIANLDGILLYHTGGKSRNTDWRAAPIKHGSREVQAIGNITVTDNSYSYEAQIYDRNKKSTVMLVFISNKNYVPVQKTASTRLWTGKFCSIGATMADFRCQENYQAEVQLSPFFFELRDNDLC